jgi:hypothetical protein
MKADNKERHIPGLTITYCNILHLSVYIKYAVVALYPQQQNCENDIILRTRKN